MISIEKATAKESEDFGCRKRKYDGYQVLQKIRL